MSGTTVPGTWPRGRCLAPPVILRRPGPGMSVTARTGRRTLPGRAAAAASGGITARYAARLPPVRCAGTLSGLEPAASQAVVAPSARAYSVMSSPGPANLASYKLTMLAIGYKIAAPLFDGLALHGPPARRRRAAGAEVMRFIAGLAARSAGEHGVEPIEGALVEHGDRALVAIKVSRPPGVERDNVVAAPQRARGQRQVVLLQRGVVPAVVGYRERGGQ